MAQMKLECPVCKAKHDLDVPEGKKIYKCPSCKLTVRVMPPQEIETPKDKKADKKPTEKETSKEEPKTVEVESAKDIPEKVTEEVNKAVEKKLEAQEGDKKPTKRRGRKPKGENSK